MFESQLHIMAKRQHSSLIGSRDSSAVASEGDSSANNDSSCVGADCSPTKRRASRAGTRSVSTLSSAQLARKRANDRDAQRAIRQRTKEHVKDLERRIEELTSVRRNDAALNEARLRNKQLEQELKNIKDSLTTVRSPTHNSAPWSTQECYGSSPILDPNIAEILDNVSIHAHSSDLFPVIEGSPMTNYQGRDRNRDKSPLSAYGADQFGLDSDLASESSWISPTQSLPNSFPTSQPSSYQMPSFLIANSTDTACSPAFLQPGICGWELPIKYLPPSTPVDELLVGIIQKERLNVLNGINTDKCVNAKKLIFSDEQLNAADDPISFISSDMINLSPIQNLPEKAACLYLLHKILRWQVSPRLDTYEDMPLWYTPRPSQLVQPHPFWVSTVFSPGLRDKMVNNQQLYCTQEFRGHLLLNVSVNWPYQDSDILIWEDGKLHLTARFEKHIRQLENYSIGKPFSDRYPELASVCPFSDVQPNLQTNLTASF